MARTLMKSSIMLLTHSLTYRYVLIHNIAVPSLMLMDRQLIFCAISVCPLPFSKPDIFTFCAVFLSGDPYQL